MRRPKSRLKACDYCRSHRLGCDRVKREPEPCSSCQDRGLGCTFTVPNRVPGETGNRRVPRSVRNSSGRPAGLRGLSFGSTGHADGVTISSPQRPDNPELPDELEIEIEEYRGGPQNAGDVVVSTEEINHSFQYFFRSMHPHFPFLNTESFSISTILEVSPLLFWTIIVIANNFRNRPLYKGLQTFVRTLVAQVLYPSGHGMETCQALCLLCLWPLEGEDPNDEPVFLYAGLLSHLAMRTGLHRAVWPQEYKNINEPVALNGRHSVRDKLNTWAACVFAEHHHACKNGLPSGIRPDWPLRSELLRPLPSGGLSAFHPTIRNIITLCLMQDRYLNVIAFEAQTPSGMLPPKDRLGHIKLFSAALDDFQISHPSLDTQSAIFFQFTRVMVGGLCLARDLQTEPLLRDESCTIVSTGVDAAVAVLDLMAPLEWETVPTHMLRAVLYSGVFAAQLLRLRHDPSLRDATEIVSILRRALDIMRHLAYGHDLATRSKIILETELQRYTAQQLIPSGDTGVDAACSGGSGIEFQTRMGAGMYWDLVEHAKLEHNWNQNAENIYRELLSSQVYQT